MTREEAQELHAICNEHQDPAGLILALDDLCQRLIASLPSVHEAQRAEPEQTGSFFDLCEQTPIDALPPHPPASAIHAAWMAVSPDGKKSFWSTEADAFLHQGGLSGRTVEVVEVGFVQPAGTKVVLQGAPLYLHPPASTIPPEHAQVIDRRTHWAAPMEATDAMAEEADDAAADNPRTLFAAMRDAYLNTRAGDGDAR